MRAFSLLLTLCLYGCFQPVSYAGTGGNATETNQALNYTYLATQMAVGPAETQKAYEAELITTAQAAETLLADAAAWQVVFEETFDDNDAGWPLDPDYGDLVDMDFAIQDGLYRMSASAHDSFIYWAYPDGTDVTDFYLSLSARRVALTVDGSFGVAFGLLDDQNYYLFRVDDAGWYILEQLDQNEWDTMIDWTVTDRTINGAWNTLEVLAQGGTFSFYINHEFVASAPAVGYFRGSVGLVCGLYEPGDEAVFEFDDVVIKAP